MKTEKEIKKRLKYLEKNKTRNDSFDYLMDEAVKIELKWVLGGEDEKVNFINRFKSFFRRMFESEY